MYKLLKKYLFMILTVTFMMNLGSAEAREANQVNTISVRSRVEQAVQANTAKNTNKSWYICWHRIYRQDLYQHVDRCSHKATQTATRPTDRPR